MRQNGIGEGKNKGFFGNLNNADGTLGNQMNYYLRNLIHVDACPHHLEIVLQYFKLVEKLNGK